MIIKRIAPLSCARIAAAVYGIAGLAIGAVIALIAASGQLPADATNGLPVGAALGAAAVIVLPLVYGCAGFLAFLIGSILYNALATIMGGVEIEIEEPRAQHRAAEE